ncbi:MAG: hypothetical protein DWQ44_11310 [Bacteroidetes bacterium]|nr:MAG: hypothetical protein DWQ33_09430 [Bacteroidota bacterium]REK05209.1 MAG: hypothetical protein DWQ39_08440 [Bacteroidota bacterium]REK32614.1 MAG: hypothetical protein DWQ44_11310 [Bacteroidota bacterium]REK48939.1 MAG: hypothetical protein DWQ48_08650 [Bacteroidota bacterium]
MKYGPLAQLIVLKLPEITLPLPISILISPFLFVETAWTSSYTALPFAEPCKMLILVLTALSFTRVLSVFLTTA